VAGWGGLLVELARRERRKKKWQFRPKFLWILKISKFGSSGGDDWPKSDFQVVKVHLPSFRIFEQVEVGFW
jgi:hypothetical protein